MSEYVAGAQQTALPSSYIRRAINLTVQLGTGTFGDSGFNTVKLTGLRVAATIKKSGMPGFNTADIRVYGVQSSIMNQISTLGAPMMRTRTNTVTVDAGDAVSGTPTAFIGTIMNAWVDFGGMPDVCLVINAQAGAIEAMKPVPPSSFPGTPDAADILSGLATQMGYIFENNGVSVILSNPYFAGTARDQAEECAKAADIYLYFDDANHKMAIWPRNGSRRGAIPLISPQTGMVGYPAYTGGGIALRTLYNPAILFGGKVQLQSSITGVNGTWIVYNLSHDLSSEMPGGPWFSDLMAYREGQSSSDCLLMSGAGSYPQNSGYLGFRNYHTANSETNLRRFQIDQRIAKVNVMKLVEVVSCTNSGGVSPVGFVDVRPMVNQIDGDNNGVPHGIIHNIPYSRIQGGVNAIIMDPAAGDIGWCGFCDSDISTVKNTKAQANPGSRRTNSLSDGIYFGGTLNGAPTQYIQFTTDGITVVSPTKITLQSPALDIESANVTINGSSLTHNDVNVGSTHEHGGVATGPANTGVPV